ncbi:MAG TPA: sialidase family protein [Planctomycetota bacterium]|nr:sialidase family protein [Planctomycetota bacterium]
MSAEACAWCWLIAAGVLAAQAAGAEEAKPAGVVKVGFIYEKAPFAQCHASTIAESGGGLVAAWFGGTAEGKPDVGIWLARNEGQGWSAPVEVANGVESPEKRYPCWNPVLFQPRSGPLLLFCKVGPSPRAWWGMWMASEDSGKTWSKPRRLPDGILGPIKNKPIQLPGGELLCGSSTEDAGWRVHFELSPDLGKTWQKIGPVNDGKAFGAIQPTLLNHRNRIQALCRSRQGRIVQVGSEDGGKTWGEMTATELPNPNAGLDAVTLADGRHLLVYNHTLRGRSPLNVAVSRDGKAWQAALVLEGEPGEFSYPAVVQTSDGLVHTTYTWRRQRVKHVVLDPAKLALRDMPDGHWPK